MAQKTWTGGSGNWTNAAAWGGTLPGPSDDVVIALGTPLVTGNVGIVRSVQDGTTSAASARLSFMGGSLRVTGALTAVAPLDVDVSGAGGSRLAVDGTLTTRTALDIGNFALANAATATAGRLVNTGTILMRGSSTGGASLQVAATAGDGTTGHLGGNYTLVGNATLSFGCGQIGTIDGLVSIQGTAAHIASGSDTTSNSALRGLSAITATGGLDLETGAAVATAGDLTNAGELDVDANANFTGGSSLKVAGTLRQNGHSFWGASRLATATTIKAAALDNTGATFVFGGTSGGAAGTVTVAVAGVTTNSGVLSLGARSVLSTGSYTQRAGGVTGFGSLLQGSPTPVSTGQITASGGVTLSGGTALLDPLAAGQALTLMTFAPGKLTGMMDNIALRGVSGTVTSGTTARQADGTLVGLLYNNAAGNITMATAAPVTTTIDTYAGGSGLWADSSHWSAGAPTFYSDVVFEAGSTNVTLDRDATVNSIALGSGDTLTTTAGTDLSIGATLQVDSGATLKVGGQMTVISEVVHNDGQVTVAGTADFRGNVKGTGQITIGDKASLELRAGDSSTVSFAGAGAQLKLDTPYLFTGTLKDLGLGDSIDLVGTKVAGAAATATTLTVTKADTSTQTFALSNRQTGTGFLVQDDGAGGSKLTVVPQALAALGAAFPCFSGALPSGCGATAPGAWAAGGSLDRVVAAVSQWEHALGAGERFGICI